VRTANLAVTCLVATTILIVGCGGATTPSPSTAPPPGASASADPAFEAVVAEAIRFRQDFGLRSDEAYVRAVAADPAAVMNYGVPLTVGEEADLNGRGSTVAELGPILQEYGEQHRDEFAGLYVDQEAGGRLVIMFTDHLADHVAALRQIVRPNAPLDVVAAPIAEADLEALMFRITNDEDRLRQLGVVVLEASVNTMASRIDVGVSSERWDVAGLLTAIYGPSVAAEVIDDTGAFLKPPGAILVSLVDEQGDPVAGCVYPEALFAELNRDAVGCEPEPTGMLRFDEVPGPWRLTPQAEGYVGDPVDVVVPPGGVVRAEIVLRPDA
jgi:hypothetical protein